jgi:hypothetical protein
MHFRYRGSRNHPANKLTRGFAFCDRNPFWTSFLDARQIIHCYDSTRHFRGTIASQPVWFAAGDGAALSKIWSKL